jgi:ribosomal protein S18 acetylase RimI-like enzyme
MALLCEEREIFLEDNRHCLLRDLRSDDLDGLQDLERDTAKDALLQGEDPDPEPLPLHLRKIWIEDVLESETRLALVAEVDGVVAGMLEFQSLEKPRLSRHVGRFYISLREDVRGMGIGRALMELMLDWARNQPQLEKISLTVLSTNEPAIGLYRSLGFHEEGRKLKEFRMPDGTYADDVLMFREV